MRKKNVLCHLKPSNLIFRSNSSMAELTDRFGLGEESGCGFTPGLGGRELKSQHWDCDSV